MLYEVITITRELFRVITFEKTFFMRSIIEAAWENRELLNKPETIEAIEHVIEEIDKGLIRVAEPQENGEWTVNEWVKKAVVLYFPIRKMRNNFV